MKKAVTIIGAIMALPFAILGMGLGFFWTAFWLGFQVPQRAVRDAGLGL